MLRLILTPKKGVFFPIPTKDTRVASSLAALLILFKADFRFAHSILRKTPMQIKGVQGNAIKDNQYNEQTEDSTDTGGHLEHPSYQPLIRTQCNYSSVSLCIGTLPREGRYNTPLQGLAPLSVLS